MPDLKQKSFMAYAMEEAYAAQKRDEVPVGAVITHKNRIIARAGNEIIARKDPTAHAEILVIRKAASLLKTERLIDCDLYVTLEPCTMCAGAISFARIRRLYYGTSDEKAGAVDNGAYFFKSASCHHVPEVYSGFCEQEAGHLLKEFFAKKRRQN